MYKRQEDTSVENDAIEASISHLNREIEGDKSEIIRILNQRASTKGKIQRYDTMMEQNQIRRAEVSQRLLRLRSEENEQEDSLKELQEKYETVSEKIEDLTEESRTSVSYTHLDVYKRQAVWWMSSSTSFTITRR